MLRDASRELNLGAPSATRAEHLVSMAREAAIEDGSGRRVRELLKLLVRTQKGIRLYGRANAITETLETRLFDELDELLSEVGPIELGIRESRIVCGEEVVYENEERNDSLAFLLFRDGIRRLSFLPGLSAGEVRRFLATLNRVKVLLDDQDDLVTLFWEEDFQCIRYVAVEELSDELGSDVRQKLASPTCDSDAAAGVARPVDLTDLEQPVVHLPSRAAQLSDGELEALRQELALEAEDDLCLKAAELAVELSALESSDEVRQELADHFVALLDNSLGEGNGAAVISAYAHLERLTRSLAGAEPAVVRLLERVRTRLAEETLLLRWLEAMDRDADVADSAVERLLGHLGADTSPTLVAALRRLKRLRRCVARCLVSQGLRAVPALARELPVTTVAAEGDGPFVTEVLFVLRELPGEAALPLLERLVEIEDPEIRLDVARALGRFERSVVDSLWLRLLDDPEREIRRVSLGALVRSGDRELAPRLLELCLESGSDAERDCSEKHRLFSAAARLGGEALLPRLESILRPSRRRWLLLPREQEIQRAAAHGIRCVGTQRAFGLLQSLADEGDRHVRAACLQELRGCERRTI